MATGGGREPRAGSAEPAGERRVRRGQGRRGREGRGWAGGGSAAVEPGWAAPEGGGPGRPSEGWCSAGWREAVAAAAAALQAGGLVAVPTDTVYGVACLAQDSAAVRSIYSLKGRNGAKPLAICLGDVERLYRCERGCPGIPTGCGCSPRSPCSPRVTEGMGWPCRSCPRSGGPGNTVCSP